MRRVTPPSVSRPSAEIIPKGLTSSSFGSYEIDGKSYTTALQKLKDAAAEYTFDLAAEKCGISAEDAERLARDWVEAENAFILSGYGLRYRNSNETYRQFLLLGALTGRLGKPGSRRLRGTAAPELAACLQRYPHQLPRRCCRREVGARAHGAVVCGGRGR